MRGFQIVVAVDEDLGIGKAGDLPWHLPSDLKHFKLTTTQTVKEQCRNAVIMGRKTWESIPQKFRPLKGRLNIVLSRQKDYELPAGVLLFHSLDSALEELSSDKGQREIETIFVVGGGKIYEEAIKSSHCKWLILTRIYKSFDCDTFFPAIENRFEFHSLVGEKRENGIHFKIEKWKVA